VLGAITVAIAKFTPIGARRLHLVIATVKMRQSFVALSLSSGLAFYRKTIELLLGRYGWSQIWRLGSKKAKPQIRLRKGTDEIRWRPHLLIYVKTWEEGCVLRPQSQAFEGNEDLDTFPLVRLVEKGRKGVGSGSKAAGVRSWYLLVFFRKSWHFRVDYCETEIYILASHVSRIQDFGVYETRLQQRTKLT
jgi:hypothetical protein